MCLCVFEGLPELGLWYLIFCWVFQITRVPNLSTPFFPRSVYFCLSGFWACFQPFQHFIVISWGSMWRQCLAFPCLEATMAIYFKQVSRHRWCCVEHFLFHPFDYSSNGCRLQAEPLQPSRNKEKWFGEVKQKLQLAGFKSVSHILGYIE